MWRYPDQCSSLQGRADRVEMISTQVRGGMRLGDKPWNGLSHGMIPLPPQLSGSEAAGLRRHLVNRRM